MVVILAIRRQTDGYENNLKGFYISTAFFTANIIAINERIFVNIILLPIPSFGPTAGENVV